MIRCVRSCAFAAAFGIASAMLPVSAPADPSPSPTPSVSSSPACDALNAPGDLVSAYAYDLTTPSILDLLLALADAPDRDHRRVYDAAVRADPTPEERRAAANLSPACPRLDVAYGTSRGDAIVVNAWHLGTHLDDTGFAAFSDALQTALNALVLADTVSPEDRTAALAPFASLLSNSAAAPMPSPSASGPCVDTSARTLHRVAPTYPALAIAESLTGTVSVKVTLNERGEVRSATLYKKTVAGEGAAQDALVRAAIFSAATSTYVPAYRTCAGVGGSYLFVASFTRR